MTPELMRGLERLAGILIGGCSIYFGFRLFELQGKRRLSEEGGSASLSVGNKFSFVMQQVGPGVFFALFGTLVVGSAMLTRLETKAASGSELKWAASAAVPATERDGVRQRIVALNHLPGMLAANVTPGQREELLLRLNEVKAMLVNSIWDPAWGGQDRRTQFQYWIVLGAKGDSLELTEPIRMFREGEGR